MTRGAKLLAVGFAVVALLAAGCAGEVDQEVCQDVALLERELDGLEGQLTPRVEQEVRDDYAELATEANCPGYDSPDT